MTSPIIDQTPLSFPWQTDDPFLFCVYHLDEYPEGNDEMGVDPKWLQGRPLGNDFVTRDGFRMYHGEVVPGFPTHPHRGFETVTLARQGFIDHSDSLGAKARFGKGDVQWITAGKGVVHSEMFPLVHRDRENTTELFQIWLNLPREKKLVEPFFAMFWGEEIPIVRQADGEGRSVEVTVVAGSYGEEAPPQPPENSWAANPDNDVAIWAIRMEPGATWTLPAAVGEKSRRSLYYFEGGGVSVAGEGIEKGVRLRLVPDAEVVLKNGDQESEFLLLQGRPIDEPVVQHGPFVMNTQGEIRQAMLDYHQTQFGGWPWESPTPVHPREVGRFAVLPDGREIRPPADGGE